VWLGSLGLAVPGTSGTAGRRLSVLGTGMSWLGVAAGESHGAASRSWARKAGQPWPVQVLIVMDRRGTSSGLAVEVRRGMEPQG
jgi:hypothetical protein